MTPGFRLPARHVVHTVGPVWAKSEDRSEQLADCYRNALRLAGEHRFTRLAFPAISCGVYGYPHDDAAQVALTTCREHGHDLDEIRFVLFGEAMYNVWAGVADDLFG